jgi:hypothetical protein
LRTSCASEPRERPPSQRVNQDAARAGRELL